MQTTQLTVNYNSEYKFYKITRETGAYYFIKQYVNACECYDLGLPQINSIVHLSGQFVNQLKEETIKINKKKLNVITYEINENQYYDIDNNGKVVIINNNTLFYTNKGFKKFCIDTYYLMSFYNNIKYCDVPAYNETFLKVKENITAYLKLNIGIKQTIINNVVIWMEKIIKNKFHNITQYEDLRKKTVDFLKSVN